MGTDDGVVVPLRPARPRPSPAPRRPRGPLDPNAEAEIYAFGGAAEPAHDAVVDVAIDDRWEQRALDALAFLQRRITGAYEVDDYGYDADLTEHLALPAFRALYEKWFRAEVNGMEHVPAEGGALLVANHAGGLWALDAAMTAVAVRLEHPAHRTLRMLGGELLFRTPGVGTLARRTGATYACAADAERLLRAGELVAAWPEGWRGLGKRFRDRYQLQSFGDGSFVRFAAAAGVPIIPVSIVGSEEIHPVLGTVRPLARLLDLPNFPVTPTFPWLGPLGLVPLPSKWYLEFGAPISAALDPHDPAAVTDVADAVRDSIQSTLYRLLVQRRSVWR